MTKVLVSALMPIYAFAVSWLYTRYFPSGLLNFTSPLVSLQVIDGLLNGIVFGALLPVTILTPPIIALAVARVPSAWFWSGLGIGLVACSIGATLASTAPRYLSAFPAVIVSVSVSAVPLVLWAVALLTIARRLRRN